MRDKNILLYTFRTNPYKDKLEERFLDLFIFGKLKEDFVKFSKKIIDENPAFIVGCTKSNWSCFEKYAFNNFNDKKIIPNGKDTFELFVPSFRIFEVSSAPTTSFCNWTIYQIANFIKKEGLDSKLIFIHFREEDYPKLLKFIETL